jgi:hypothetical protein
VRIYKLLLATGLLLSSLQAFGQSRPTFQVPKSVADAPAETMGTVIGTIGYRLDRTPRVDQASFDFRMVGQTDVGYVEADRGFLGVGKTRIATLSDGKFRYSPFSMQLPEGRYEIIRVTGVYELPSQCVGATSQTKYANETAFSVPFEVKRGKTLYLGSFLAHGTLEKKKVCFIPIPAVSTVYLSYADKWQRDAKVFPGIDAAQVEHATLSVNERTGYYIIAEDHLPEKVSMKDFSAGKLSHAGKIAAYQALHGAGASEPQVQPTQASQNQSSGSDAAEPVAPTGQ